LMIGETIVRVDINGSSFGAGYVMVKLFQNWRRTNAANFAVGVSICISNAFSKNPTNAGIGNDWPRLAHRAGD